MLLNYNIISPNSLQFKKVEQLLVDSFPVDERRDMLDFERIARENPRFSLLGALEGNNVKGFITTWDFDSFCYVEHFAVDSSVRNQGIGSRLLDHFVAQAAKPVILEVELPADLPACRRIAFYKRHQFVLWEDVDYVQPPYSPSRQALPMRLMTRGFDTAAAVEQAASELKRVVYGCVDE